MPSMYIRYHIKIFKLFFSIFPIWIRFSIGNEINLIVLTFLILKCVY